jgi:hypothetical protein
LLFVTANSVSRAYGAADPALGVLYSGFVNGEDPSVLGGTLAVVDADPATNTAVGSYAGAITASGLTAANYAIPYVAGDLSVTPASLYVTASSVSRVYGAVDPAPQVSYSGFVNSEGPSALGGTLAVVDADPAASTAVGGYTGAITASGLTSGNYAVSYVAGDLTVTPAPLTVTATGKSMTYGGSVPALTYTYTGLVNGDSSASFSSGLATTATSSSNAGGYSITQGNLAATGNYTIGSFNVGTLTVNPAPLSVTASNQSMTQGGTVPALTYTYTGLVNGNTSATFTGGLTTTGTSSSSAGSYPINQGTLAATGNYTIGAFIPGTLTVTATGGIANGSIYILDPTAGGALTLSGSAGINVPGNVIIDSKSPSALTISGAASVKAASIRVAGNVSKSGSPTFSPQPVTGAAGASDPLAGLPMPALPSNPTNYGSKSIGGSTTTTLQPGLYTQISVSGAANVALAAGTYVIQGGGLSAAGSATISIGSGTSIILEGGGLSVSGAAAISGSSVTIFNFGTAYNGTTDGGSFGPITLSGSGSVSLTAPASGTYAGILIFQARDNSKTLTFSGAAMQGTTGTIYAPAAQLVESGSAQIGSTSHPISIIVDTMTLSGAAVANGLTLSASAGTVAYSPAQIRDAYGISNLALDGTGQTIAIVDAYDDPSIIQSVDAFDSQFGLTNSGTSLYQQYGPASSFLTVLNQSGQPTSLPGTDPNGAGLDNWEVEEALDVEWVHAIAPGAQIVLVEASSQSLSDLMAAVATAARQPGVSVVSMRWGFAEGQQVFAADEAMYDSYFQVPGVTFVASTGDYGAADPEYPAYSPNVVSVGGTSLTLNGDNSYNSETGWGYQSASAGAFIGSGGGLSQYESEPAFQQGVQSTGFRTTPDVSLVADPATGAWIADTYNLDPSNPFEVVGGTSLSSPAWAGLLALVNQGSAAAGKSALNSASPTEAGQALYSLPQNDYNAIESGNNGYTAGAGYDLVTGLGTPVANLVVSDLVAYLSGTFVASGPTVGALSNANLVNTGAAGSGTTNVFAVFDSLIDMGNGLGLGQNTVANPATAATLAVAPTAASQSPSTGSLAEAGHGLGLGTMILTVANPGSFGVMPISPSEVTAIPITTASGLTSRQPAVSMSRPGVNMTKATKLKIFGVSRRTERSSALGLIPISPQAGQLTESILDDVARDSVMVLSRGRTTGGATGLLAIRFAGTTNTEPGQVASRLDVPGFAPVSDDSPAPVAAEQPAGFTARLAAILLAVGDWRRGAILGTSGKRSAGSPAAKKAPRKARSEV